MLQCSKIQSSICIAKWVILFQILNTFVLFFCDKIVLFDRKPDRERAEDFDHTSRESNYFGLSPEERREKQAIEESRLLYEIQNRDEQAFPALSVCIERDLKSYYLEVYP